MLLKFRNIVHLLCIRFVGNEINEANYLVWLCQVYFWKFFASHMYDWANDFFSIKQRGGKAPCVFSGKYIY